MNQDCCESYRQNLNGNCSFEKLTLNSKFPKTNIVIGGPPCQPFSVHGKQKGKEDERNGQFTKEAFRKPMNFIRGMNESKKTIIAIDKTLNENFKSFKNLVQKNSF